MQSENSSPAFAAAVLMFESPLSSPHGNVRRRMLYRDTVEFLYSLQLFGARLGLERATRLASLAGEPQNQLRFIHVAGTNGKGSTCAMLESIYRHAGRRVGLYTSPHLVSVRERIQINRAPISEDDVVRLVEEEQRWLAEFSSDDHPTFFEVVTIIALRYFAEQKCDLVIWETGLGGRLDATNIVTPLASVITNVQFDHEQWLGHTLEEIAAEKAGIIKPHVPVVTSAEAPEALAVIRRRAAELRAPLHFVSMVGEQPSVARGLHGKHQAINAALAIKTVDVLQEILPVNDESISSALESVQWPGRFQIVARGAQKFVLDGAHNPAGARALADTVMAEFPNQQRALVLGVLEDKNWEKVCQTLAPLFARIVLVPVKSQRTANPELLAPRCRAANPLAEVRSVRSLREALSTFGSDALIVITGSLYLIGEAMELLGLAPAANEGALNEWSTSRQA